MSADLIERLRDQASHLELGMATPLDTTTAAKHLIALSYEAADALAAMHAEHEAARQNFHTMQHAANALRQRAEKAEAALSEMRAELERARKALEEIRDETEVHTKLSQERLCCKFQDIAARALSQDEPADLGVGG